MQDELRYLAVRWRATYRQFPTGLVLNILKCLGALAFALFLLSVYKSLSCDCGYRVRWLVCPENMWLQLLNHHEEKSFHYLERLLSKIENIRYSY